MAHARVHTPMAETSSHFGAEGRDIAQAVLYELFGPPEQRSWAVRFWDGAIEGPERAPQFALFLQRPGALRRMLLPPSEIAIGEAYLRDDFDLGGTIEAATLLIDQLAEPLRSPVKLACLTRLLLQLPTNDLPVDQDEDGRPLPKRGRGSQSRPSDMQVIRYHYDVGSEFYTLWLDARLLYSCAYFRRDDDDLETAQTAKLEHLCRKLRLKPGERLLDIGCGWGGLVQYAAAHYGVQALGITPT